MNPNDLLYAKSHEWAKIAGEVAAVGITDFAQEQLGDLVFVELPAVGDTFAAGDEMGSVESVKAASEIYCPVSGEVVEVNEDLEASPGKVNEDPYGAGWMIKVKLAEAPKGLLTSDEYEATLEG